jgi:hypothetical protein
MVGHCPRRSCGRTVNDRPLLCLSSAASARSPRASGDQFHDRRRLSIYGRLGYFDDGRLAEIFLNAEKVGTAIETAARDSAVVASLALQHGVPADTIRRALTRNSNGNASGPLASESVS